MAQDLESLADSMGEKIELDFSRKTASAPLVVHLNDENEDWLPSKQKPGEKPIEKQADTVEQRIAKRWAAAVSAEPVDTKPKP